MSSICIVMSVMTNEQLLCVSLQFADALLKFGYSKVCVLHKGIDVMRSTGLLVVPTPEL